MPLDHAGAAASFQESAGAYDELLAHNVAGADRLVASMPPGDYRDLLDVGCGTGFATTAFARRFAPERIAGVDPAAAMLDVFRARRGDELGEATLELHAADVLAMPVPDGAFDAVISSMAFHWFPDKPAALIAMGAKLRPGGVLALLTAGTGTDGAFREVLRTLDPPAPPQLDATFDFAQREIADVEGYLTAAGLEPVDVWTERRGRVADPDAYLARMRAVASHVTAGTDADALAELTARITAATHAAAAPDGFHYEFVKLYAIARKPS